MCLSVLFSLIYLFLFLDRWIIIYFHELITDNCAIPVFISLILVGKIELKNHKMFIVQ